MKAIKNNSPVAGVSVGGGVTLESCLAAFFAAEAIMWACPKDAAEVDPYPYDINPNPAAPLLNFARPLSKINILLNPRYSRGVLGICSG